MKNKEIKRLLNSAAQKTAPDVLDSVLSGCEQQKGRNFVMTNATTSESPRRRPGIRGLAIGIAAFCLLLVGGIGGFFGYQNTYAVDSIVAFDVNPSIRLEVSRQEKVLSAEPLNADASKILFDMNLEGTDLNVATNAIIGSMLRNGYLSDIANSILITVENGDDEKAAALQQELVDEINQILGSNNIEGSILSQTLTASDDLKAKAETYGISTGKASLIEGILAENTQYTFEDLASLSIRELNILADAGEITSVSSSGSVSTKGYISETEARDAALADAGVDASSVTVQKLSLDWEDGRVVYDVEFYDQKTTYEYEIDATSGEIVKRETEVSPLASGDVIGLEAAKSAAVKDAGISSPTFTKATLDRDDGRSLYEIEFISGSTKYEYDIDALTGSVLSKKTRALSSSSGTGTDGLISEADARAKALADAGLSESGVTFGKVELDYDDGRWEYEIEFYTSAGKYEYDIDASSGAILQKESEAAQTGAAHSGTSSSGSASSGASSSGTSSSGTSSSGSGASSVIEESRAKDIALQDAGVSASAATFTQMELERDDGRWEYEIDFYANGTEYEYTIDAQSGTILKRDSESEPGKASSSTGVTVSMEEAKALAQAKAPNATLVEISFDYDDGIPVYEGELREGQTEYEFEIDGRNGSFLKWEADHG